MTAIVFDLDGTLLQFDRPYRDVLSGAIKSVRGTVPDGWIDAYNEAFFESFSAHEPDPARRAFDRLDGCTDPDPYAHALLEHEIAAASPPERARADLERLGDQHTLGVLTNGVRPWQLAKLRAHDLESCFDAVVASYEVGAHKPDPKPFRAIERRLEADRFLIVGDSDADVDGAAAAGWTSHRYDGGGFGNVCP